MGALRPGRVGVHPTNGEHRRSQEIKGDVFGKVVRPGVERREGRVSRWNVAGMATARLGLVVSRG